MHAAASGAPALVCPFNITVLAYSNNFLNPCWICGRFSIELF